MSNEDVGVSLPPIPVPPPGGDAITGWPDQDSKEIDPTTGLPRRQRPPVAPPEPPPNG